MADLRCDRRAELAVLGASFTSPTAHALARGLVRAPDFAEPAHGVVFEVLGALADARAPIDRVTLEAALTERGAHAAVTAAVDLDALDFCGLGADGIETHARIVADHAEARRLRQAATALLRVTNDPRASAGALRARVGELLGDALRGQALRGPRPFGDLAQDYYRILEASRERGPGIDGLPTGVAALDALLSGLHGGELIVVGARPRVGKSALVMQMAVAAAEHAKKPVLGFSLEMSAVNLFGRTAHARAGIDASLVRNGMLTQETFDALAKAVVELAALPVYLDDAASATVADIAGKATALAARDGLALLFVDYLQLIEAAGERGNRQLDVSAMSRGLKTLAKQLDIPVVVLAQLNREVDKRPDKRPTLPDLRESGALEQDADVVIFLYRDVLYNPKTEDPNAAEIIVAKQRNGATDTIHVRWEGAFTRFAEATERDYEPPRTVTRATEMEDSDGDY